MRWWLSRKRDADLERELRSDLELEEEELRERGLSPKEAHYAALRAFGNPTLIREQTREAWGWTALERFLQDLRYALRHLRRSPGFTLIAVLILALGIGAVTSVFSVVNGVLLKPFSFRDPDRLVVMREAVDDAATGRTAIPNNYRHFLRLKNGAATIEDAAIFSQTGLSVSSNGDHPRIVGAIMASPNLFHVLGVEPMLGRGFVEADAKKGSDNVVLLSYEGWQAFFAGDPKAVGRTLRIGGQPITILGVLPPGMRFPQIALAPKTAFQEMAHDALLFVPLAPSERDLTADMGNFNYKAIARLKPDVSLAQASAELDAMQKAYTISAHLPLHFGIALTPLTKDVASGISGALWLLLAAVGAVLLIACVNLANLQLARAVNAERETAVRAALGASRAQLVRSRLTESLLLALMGGAAGAGLAFAGVRLLIFLVPANVPRLDEVHVNAPVLLFAAGISMVAAITFGILPALRSLRVPPRAALQANSARTANTQEGRRTRSLMVATQVACTVVLLIVTSLALRSFSHLLHQNRGFDASHVTVAQVDLFAPQYDDSLPNVKAVKLAFVDRALAALRQLPGVQSVAITSVAPLTGETWVDNITRPDHPVPAGKEPMINVRWINPDYLPTMQSQLVAGRNFTAADRANPYVALISERAAREGFPGEDPIGRKIINIVPDDKHPITVIGVVADARINGLKDDAAMVYMPHWAFTPWVLSFLVRSSQPSDALIPEMQRAIWQIDPQVAIPLLKSMDDQVNDSVATDRFQAIVLTSFGAAALLLALLGVYGVLSYSVSLRRQEFGVRIALGSGKGALVRLVLRQAAYPVLFGAGIGMVMALAALRWVRSLLYQTPVMDPFAIGFSVVLLLAAAAIAAVVPAHRAASIDPMKALRTE
ncbi:MAG TPA: ABC transporter permease [Acidobacteriaceae bacterium]|jgi:predicted permease|nr:ABC transporter permease [Acidobacteriaceae bacterium]